jgi:hypothetical protein
MGEKRKLTERYNIDPVDQTLQSKYEELGLTYISNNTSVVDRDEFGNVKLQEQGNNPLLIIEPVYKKILNKSVTKVIDTQFNYFKFPVRITEEEFDLEIDDLGFDPVFARYRPSEDRRILTESTSGNGKFNGILMDFVEEGNFQKSANKYYITKDIKNSGVDLRFRIQIQHRFDSAENISNDYGTAYFSIIKDSPTTGLNRSFKGDFANVANTPTIYPTTIPIPTSPPPAPYGYIGRFQVQTLNLDITILNSEFEIGDYLSIGAFAGQNVGEKNNDGIPYEFHTINAITSYWVVSDASKNVDEWNQPAE